MMKNNLVTSVVILIAVIVVGYLLINKTSDVPVDEVNTGAQGKIDINAVCEGALAYMTFPDGASAELFVEECKEGKHPQVIEKFKTDMNLGDGAEI
jgi:hypothetical protein